jgi:membrane protease YdiL (CAAX protease family)
MVDELARPTRVEMERAAEAPSCRYCGAPLDPCYYFCLNCATPHRTVESVLPAVYVAPPTEDVLIRRRAPHAWPLFWTYLSVIVGAAVACWAAFGPGQQALSIAIMSAAVFVTTCVFAAIHWTSLSVQFRRLGLLDPAAWIGLAALVPMLAVNYGYHVWFLRVIGYPYANPIPEIRESLGEGGMVLFICVLPAVMEEIAFRGLLQHWLQVAIRPMRAVILASALFTALHFSAFSAPYLFAVGMVLGLVKLKTGSLYPSMLIHFLHNLAVVELFALL